MKRLSLFWFQMIYISMICRYWGILKKMGQIRVRFFWLLSKVGKTLNHSWCFNAVKVLCWLYPFFLLFGFSFLLFRVCKALKRPITSYQMWNTLETGINVDPTFIHKCMTSFKVLWKCHLVILSMSPSG